MSNIDFNQDSSFPAQQAGFNSMRNVRDGNKAAWLDLFAEEAVVQDPVGVSPFDPAGQGHRGKAAISAFWDNVIVRNPGRFRIRQSHPCADECANVITTTRTLPNGAAFDLDFVVVYRVDGAGKIVSLKAYWQYDAMVAQVKALLVK